MAVESPQPSKAVVFNSKENLLDTQNRQSPNLPLHSALRTAAQIDSIDFVGSVPIPVIPCSPGRSTLPPGSPVPPYVPPQSYERVLPGKRNTMNPKIAPSLPSLLATSTPPNRRRTVKSSPSPPSSSGPCFPELAGNSILLSAMSSVFNRSILQALSTKSVKTVGQLASLPLNELKALKIPNDQMNNIVKKMGDIARKNGNVSPQNKPTRRTLPFDTSPSKDSKVTPEGRPAIKGFKAPSPPQQRSNNAKIDSLLEMNFKDMDAKSLAHLQGQLMKVMSNVNSELASRL